MLESVNNDSIYLKTYEGCLCVPEIYIMSKNDYKTKNFENFDKCQSYISDQIKLIRKL